MPTDLAALQRRRAELLDQLTHLRPFRPGSISLLLRPCGKPGCRCAQPDDPGHGPNMRLTYKLAGKTYSESLPTPAAVRKAEREIAEYRKFQLLSHEFVEVNASLCRLNRPATRSLRDADGAAG